MHGGPWAGQSGRVSAGVPEQNSFTLPPQGHLAMSGGWASGRWPGTLLNIPQCPGRTPPQRMIQPRMSAGLRMRNLCMW